MSKEENKLFVHPNKTVYVLIPVDGYEESKVRDALSPHLDALPDEQKPYVVTQLRLGRLPVNAMIYVASMQAPKKGAQPALRLGDPIPVSQFTVQRLNDPDGLGGVNIGALTDEIQKHTKRAVRLSAEKDVTMKVVKLFGT